MNLLSIPQADFTSPLIDSMFYLKIFMKTTAYEVARFFEIQVEVKPCLRMVDRGNLAANDHPALPPQLVLLFIAH